MHNKRQASLENKLGQTKAKSNVGIFEFPLGSGVAGKRCSGYATGVSFGHVILFEANPSNDPHEKVIIQEQEILKHVGSASERVYGVRGQKQLMGLLPRSGAP